jgi:hypothetical protein
LYLAGPAATIFEYYDANHHFLATLLFRISVALLGHAEWAIRLPSVLAGWWFLWTLWRLTRLSLGPGPLAAMAAAAVAANPFVGDFLVAARGYGLALACFTWAIYCLIRYGSGTDRDWLLQAGAAGALSIAANLAFALPVACLFTAFVTCLPRSPIARVEDKSNKKKNRQKVAKATAAWIPLAGAFGLVLVLFLLSAPLHRAERGHFYVGADSVLQSLRSFGAASFFYPDGTGLLADSSGWRGRVAEALGLVGALAALSGMFCFRKAQRGEAKVRLCWLCSASASGAMALALILHFAGGFPLLAERTGLYFLLLAPLALGAQAAILLDKGGLARWGGLALALIGTAAAGRFALSMETRSFYLWRYDADTKAMVKQIESLHSAAQEGKASLGAS